MQKTTQVASMAFFGLVNLIRNVIIIAVLAGIGFGCFYAGYYVGVNEGATKYHVLEVKYEVLKKAHEAALIPEGSLKELFTNRIATPVADAGRKVNSWMPWAE